jgi:ABC-type branched-subunit amino acid transport system substrate-binding protein
MFFSLNALAQVNDRINTDNLDTNDEGGRVLKNRDIIQDENKQSIKVAIILPLSGDNQGTGERLAKSIPLIENLNGNFQYDKQFGLQYQFDITIKDDGCDIEKAKKIARDIVANGKYLFVIGHFCSGASQAVAPIYERAGIVQITPFSTEPSLTERGYQTFFRLAGRNDRYGEVAADWLHEFRNRYKLATIYGDDTYGKSLVDNVIIGLDLRSRSDDKKKQNDYYSTPINLQEYEKNIPELVDKLIKDNVKLVYYGGYYSKLAKIIKQVKRKKAKIIFFAGDSIQNYDFWVQSNGEAENVIFTLTKDVTRDISQQELNQIQRTIDFNKIKSRDGLEEAIRIYGIQSSRSIFNRNRIYKDRARFIRTYFEQNKEFPDLYMSHLYAVFEIIKDVVVTPDLQDIFADLSAFKTKIEKKQLASDIATYMKDKGYNTGDEYVGFRTILGTVNFSNSGDWVNSEYVIYRWINKPQDRNWLTEKKTQKFIGANGDFIRLF